MQNHFETRTSWGKQDETNEKTKIYKVQCSSKAHDLLNFSLFNIP